MIFKQPTHYFIAAGHAEGYSPLNAFDQALLEAGVGDTNLVRMSSILPPSCQRIEPIDLPYGALVPVAYADMVSSNPGEWIAAAVAIGVPADPKLPGLIMEHHGVGRLDEIEAQVREMAVQGMAYRNREIQKVVSIGMEHQVDKHGAAFAGVVLWDESVRGREEG
ncbi:arginine decarboxylase, pyruvoyl-dependent [Persicimonas caeni]|uniref:Pyruvoyl-dependent arginine decarboxylase AaxB n=1 Tax=Persicimonas caeni TaxID=2292766 RepID=A0A4Y6PZ32_PERCE|nr:arginine decarboxylase, pyruvoyl-dependent [Persicimonas caeni]QDG53572.1 arginine decarboxylase, pyruvoyl-dependent [Persicimonas caeni]QED34793.1 arginine decarboxylase, pyruvoyl-dependent [Persicimonas caeni]